ncbi:MAG: Fur family transcriptional regulator [Phycisphaerae bacterium]|nr:Fur family transcriptional regulator [Phycisphaerae bacterium]
MNNNLEQSMFEEFSNACRKAGLKITPQRLAVYQCLAKSKEHPSAESVYQQVKKVYPNISLDTVNRTLVTLAKVGLAFTVEGSGDAKRFDANFDGHQHFKCLKCKKIVDFYYEPFKDIELPEKLRRKFEVVRKTFYLEGYCKDCKRE